MSRFYNRAYFRSTWTWVPLAVCLLISPPTLSLSVAHFYALKLLTPSSASSLYWLAGTLMFPAFTSEPYISLAAILEGKASLFLRLNPHTCFWLQFSFPVQMTLSPLASNRPVSSVTCTGITTVRQFPTGISWTSGCSSLCLPVSSQPLRQLRSSSSEIITDLLPLRFNAAHHSVIQRSIRNCAKLSIFKCPMRLAFVYWVWRWLISGSSVNIKVYGSSSCPLYKNGLLLAYKLCTSPPILKSFLITYNKYLVLFKYCIVALYCLGKVTKVYVLSSEKWFFLASLQLHLLMQNPLHTHDTVDQIVDTENQVTVY